jgi:ABC-type polysaccharide transport system permease subunit
LESGVVFEFPDSSLFILFPYFPLYSHVLALQDFHMLVSNPKKQKLSIQVKDALGFADLTIGTGEVYIMCAIPKVFGFW